MNINYVRLNCHGLKSKNYTWVEGIIHDDPRNSFDMGFFSEAVPGNFIVTSFHDAHDDETLFPMFGFSNIGNRELTFGVE